MEAVYIKGTDITPTVILDATKNKFEFKGSSRPENAVEFYEPLLLWLNNFNKFSSKSNAPIVFTFYFDYLNSVSVKLLFDVFKTLEKNNSHELPINIAWLFNHGDTDMKETGEEYSKLLKLPFSIVAVNK